jgi:hypothetical protein
MAQADATERWLPVVGWEDIYEVSDRGRVRRCGAHNVGRWPPGRITTGTANAQGYRRAMLQQGERRSTPAVHRLVLEAFIGPCPPGHEVNHKNGNKADNRLVNLEYLTPPANSQHAVDTGLRVYSKGDAHHRTRYPDAVVDDWRRRYADGETATQIAAGAGLHRSRVWEIVTGHRRTPLRSPPER